MKNYLHFSARLICLLLCSFSLSSLFAQVTFDSYHKKDGEETKQRDSAYFLRTIHVDAQEKDKIYHIEEYFLRNDSIKLNGVSKTARAPFKFQGKKYEFYENGTLKSLENFSDWGERIDSAFYLYPNNKLEKILFYASSLDKNGKLQIEKPIYVVYYDSLYNKTLENGTGRIRLSMAETDDYEEGGMVNNLREGEWKGRIGKDSFVENFRRDKLLSGMKTKENGTIISYDSTTYFVFPEYIGGIHKLMSFVSRNFDYPKEALKNRVSGILEISFVVNKAGELEDIKVKHDLGFGTGEAGIRVVEKLGKWKPGIIRGELVRVAYTLPIRLNMR